MLSFYVNLVLTIVAFILTILINVFDSDKDLYVGSLVILGLYQVATSFVLTMYAIAINKYLLALYIIYWVLVTLFFKFFLHEFFFMCLVIAVYNLYVNYCSFSDSKFNILNK
jgi:hypothetical protein